ncbi:hypothetical protein ACHAWU_001648 [Discostella pseudostelligera]|uniref:Peptidase M11 gametolysin domain-containing protein n=1 Tax=Discostella pseudostelligera TaxID=259834 RepID=A0ABD3MG02_9STRA
MGNTARLETDDNFPFRKLQHQGKSSDHYHTDNIQLLDGTIYEVKNAQAGWAVNLVSGTDNVHIPPGAVISSDGTIDMKGQKPTMVPGVGLGHRDLVDRGELHSDCNRKLQSGTRTVLAVRVILNDGSYSYASQSGLSNDLFGNGVDPYNLKSQYASCSYNQLIFNKASDRSMSTTPNDGTTAITAGVVDVKVDLSVAAGDSIIRNAVTTKIDSVFGVSNPYQLANHVMYCMPPGVMSGIAYAYINSWNSVYSNEWCNFLSAQMHEIGHNLGYAHSNEGGYTYDDQSCIMGYSYGYDDSPIMCFNAAKSWQSKWYTSKSTVVDPSAGNCFLGNVYGIADYGSAASSTVLVKIDDASATDYYVAFNRKIGINSGTQEAGNQVTVVKAGGEGSSYAESDLVAKLSVGGSWSGVVDGKIMIVKVLNINTSSSPGYAQVRISEDGNLCGGPPDPTPPPCLASGALVQCSNTVNPKCCSGKCSRRGSTKNTCV